MTGKAAMTKPAQHIPTHTPAGHADGQFGFRPEGLPPTVACRVRTAHQTVDHLGRSRQRPQMMIAVVADIHGTVTDRTRAFLDIKIDPCEDGLCRPTIRHGGSTLVLKLVDGSRRVCEFHELMRLRERSIKHLQPFFILKNATGDIICCDRVDFYTN